MIEHLSNIFKKVFNNEETVTFALIIIVALVVFSFFASVLTPFIISIIVAYLLVGLQKKYSHLISQNQWLEFLLLQFL